MKSKLKRLLFIIMRFTGLARLVSICNQRKAVTIIYYHAPDPVSFSRHLGYIKKKGYNAITLKQAADALLANRLDTLPEYSLVITFDDGHASNYLLAPILREYKITATIFLTVDICGTDEPFWFLSREFDGGEKKKLKEVSDSERRMMLNMQKNNSVKQPRQALSLEEIGEMADVIDFQSHTLTHPCLSNCSDEVAMSEIEGSRKKLENMTGSPVYAICWPNGDYSSREIQYAEQAGYSCGLTGDHGYMNHNTGRYSIKRVSMNDTVDINEFAVRVTGLWGYIKNMRLR